MYKIKTSYYYLERGFPENLEPALTGQSTKRKRLLVERRKRILKRSIRKSLRTLVKPFFSAPTKKGVLLPESKYSFKDGSSQVEKENLQKRCVASIPTTERGGPKVVSMQTIEAVSCKRQEGYQANRQDLLNLSKSEDPLVVFSSGRKHDKRLPLDIATARGRGPAKRSKPPLKTKCRRYKFLFPLHRLKGELSKRESQYGKIELYKKQIQEKKKLAFIYGIVPKNSIKKLVKQAYNLSSVENPPTKVLVALLESRLDVTLFRASFFSSVPMARQWINHNKVTVNKNKVRSPGYQLKGGDCIEVLPAFAFPLKEKIQRRIGKILPFRRSRKKLITPSLIESWCSFERVFSSEKTPQKTPSLIRDKKVLAAPAAIENFSLIKDHLQSIWEKSIHSQRSWRGGNETSPAQDLSFGKRDQKSLPTLSQPTKVSRGGFSGEKPPQENFLAKTKNKVDKGEIFSSLARDRLLPRHLSRQIDARAPLDRKWRKPLACSNRIHPHLQKGITLFGRLKKEKAQALDFLNAKQALVQPRNRVQRLAGLQISGMKPLHLEISYKLLTAIFLYSPQKVAYPSNLDLPLIIRSLK